MSNQECPACGAEYTKRAEITMGDSWAGIIGQPPHTLFGTYARICAHPDAMRAAGSRGIAAIPIFCHTARDFQSSIG